MTTVYRADTVGSLLRPDYLVRARAQYESGALAPAHYKEMLEAVVGLSPDPEGSQSDHIPVPFHDEGGSAQSVFTIPISVTDKVRRARMMTVEEYAYARARAHRPIKVTLPSPLMPSWPGRRWGGWDVRTSRSTPPTSGS
jgi:methionine synthase II (cobalamin-independent)